jgi:flagellar protein FliO/FliZ
MRPNHIQRVAFGGWFLATICTLKLPIILCLGASVGSSFATRVQAQSQPGSILRPHQAQTVAGAPREEQVLQGTVHQPDSYPSEAWTSSRLPPLPGAPETHPSMQTGGVGTASSSQPMQSSASTTALRGQNAGADSPSKERTPLAPRSTKATSETKSRGSSGTFQMLVSVGSSLLIVIGLFLGVAWCYRKTLNQASLGLPKQVVKVLGRTPIAPRQQLLVVRFGSKLVLVSMVQGDARALSEITDPLEVDQLAGMCESSQPGSVSASFRSILNQGGATV